MLSKAYINATKPLTKHEIAQWYLVARCLKKRGANVSK